MVNNSTVGNTSIASVIYSTDAGTAANTNIALKIDGLNGTTNNSATVTGIQVNNRRQNTGNLIDLQTNSASVFKVTTKVQ